MKWLLGAARSICGNVVTIDFGDLDDEVSMMEITFHNRDAAWKHYCKLIKFDMSIVEDKDKKTEVRCAYERAVRNETQKEKI